MLHKHITIKQLTILEIYYHNRIGARDCAKRMKIGKDKVYKYYKCFSKRETVEEIHDRYKINKKNCGVQEKELSPNKLKYINNLLEKDWSLDAISGRDKLENEEERLSTSTLYKLARNGVIDQSKLRRKGKTKKNGQIETRGKINNCKTIHERNEKYPKILYNAEYGHFEGDTIVGEKRKSAIVTLVEKTSKYIVLLKASRKSEDVKESVNNWISSLKENLVKTITFDRGKEFSKWREMEGFKGILEVYFSDPGSPGQRGLNENSNGIVRKDLPKSTDLSVYSQEELNAIMDKWNNIPRKILGYLTPSEVLEKTTGVSRLI